MMARTADRILPVRAGQGIAAALLAWWRTRAQPAAWQLRLVETLPLGPKRSIALIELDGERFLAGMGADGVTTLLRVAHDKPDEVCPQ